MIFNETMVSDFNGNANIYLICVENGDMPPYDCGDVLLIKNSGINIDDIVVTTKYTVERYKGQDVLGKIIAEHTGECAKGV